MNDREQYLEFCAIDAADAERPFAVYKWSHLPTSGRTDHDEDVSDWSDAEITDCFCDLIGIEHEQDRAVVVVKR